MQAALKFKKECFFYHVIQKNQLRFLIMYRSVKVLNTLSHSRILIRIVIFYLFYLTVPRPNLGHYRGNTNNVSL